MISKKGANIANAFSVVRQTYKSVGKLWDYLNATNTERNNYILRSDKMIRWRTDSNPSGWLISDFVILFQEKNTPELESGWFDSPVFILELNFWEEDEPMIYFARFEYSDMRKNPPRYSPADHWVYWEPLKNKVIDYKNQGEIFYGEVKSKKTANKFSDLVSVCYESLPLVELTSTNCDEKIFGAFDRLKAFCGNK